MVAKKLKLGTDIAVLTRSCCEGRTTRLWKTEEGEGTEMPKKKRSGRRHISAGKPSSEVHLSVARGRRGLIPAIITMAAIVIAVAVWLGLHPSGARSGVESSVAGQPDRVAVDNKQSSSTVTGGPSIHFPEPSHDFGTISQGAKVAHTFAVKNTGSEPLKLIRAHAS